MSRGARRAGWLLAMATAMAFAMPSAGAAAARDSLSVVTLNLWHDQRDWPARMRRIVTELRAMAPDVICLQEVLEHETLPNQAAALADSLGLRAHFVSVDPESSRKRYGNAILTGHRVLRSRGRFLLPLNDYRVVAHTLLEVRGRRVDVYDTHLHHTPEGGAIRAEQIRDLLAFVDSTRGDGARVLAGDFNCEPGSPELAALDRGYLDAFAVANPRVRGAAAATMNPALGSQPLWIDHVFVPRTGRPRLAPRESRVIFADVGPDSVWASDHFGVYARFEFDGR